MFKMIGSIIAASCLVATAALAEDYPGSRPVSMMMPYAAGGPGDTVTRITAAGINKALGGTFIVENLAGAGGTIGTAKVASATPDGHSLLLMHFGHAANKALYRICPMTRSRTSSRSAWSPSRRWRSWRARIFPPRTSRNSSPT